MDLTLKEENQSESFHAHPSVQLQKYTNTIFYWQPKDEHEPPQVSSGTVCYSTQSPLRLMIPSSICEHLEFKGISESSLSSQCLAQSTLVDVRKRSIPPIPLGEMILFLCTMPPQCIEPSLLPIIYQFGWHHHCHSVMNKPDYSTFHIDKLEKHRNQRLSDPTHVSWFLFWTIWLLFTRADALELSVCLSPQQNGNPITGS